MIGSDTTSATSTDTLLLSSLQSNVHIQSVANSIVLDADHGIKILKQTPYASGLLFMDTTTRSAIYTADYVGLQGQLPLLLPLYIFYLNLLLAMWINS